MARFKLGFWFWGKTISWTELFSFIGRPIKWLHLFFREVSTHWCLDPGCVSPLWVMNQWYFHPIILSSWIVSATTHLSRETLPLLPFVWPAVSLYRESQTWLLILFPLKKKTTVFRGVGLASWHLLTIASFLTGEGNGNPLQCSCLENPRDGGAW